MENLNVEEDEVQPWFGGPNEKWRCLGLLSVTATVGLSLWHIHQLRQQNAQLQKELGKNRLIIKDKDGARKYSVYNSIFIREPFVEQTPENEQPMQVETVMWSPESGKLHQQINELEDLLEERQHIFCSYFRPRFQRLRLEEQIKEHCKAPELEEALKDRSCGNCLSSLWSVDKRRNGREIWEYLQKRRLTMITNVEKKPSQKINFLFPHSEEKKPMK